MSNQNDSEKYKNIQPAATEPTSSKVNSSQKFNQQQQGPSQASHPRTEASSEEGPFEEIDIKDPPEEPSFEIIKHEDARHSSYNSQPDHVWKYNPPVEEPFSALKPEFKPTRTKAELEALEELEKKKRERR